MAKHFPPAPSTLTDKHHRFVLDARRQLADISLRHILDRIAVYLCRRRSNKISRGELKNGNNQGQDRQRTRLVSARRKSRAEPGRSLRHRQSAETKLAELKHRLLEIADLNAAGALLGWDHGMAPGDCGALARAIAARAKEVGPTSAAIRQARTPLRPPEPERFATEFRRVCGIITEHPPAR